MRIGVAGKELLERFANRSVELSPTAEWQLVVKAVAEERVAEAQTHAAAGYLGNELLGYGLVEQFQKGAALQTACACEHVEVELATEHRRE